MFVQRAKNICKEKEKEEKNDLQRFNSFGLNVVDSR